MEKCQHRLKNASSSFSSFFIVEKKTTSGLALEKKPRLHKTETETLCENTADPCICDIKYVDFPEKTGESERSGGR